MRKKALTIVSTVNFTSIILSSAMKMRPPLHFNAVIDEKMEGDFTGKSFKTADPLNDKISTVLVFVAVLLYSQPI